MVLSDVSVKRPVFATVISLLLIAFGMLSFFDLPIRQFPNIDSPIVSVETNYPGASAEIVETRVTQQVEDQIAGIAGIRSVSSTSREGRSNITIEFNIDRNIDAAANDVRDRVSRVLDNLPEEAEPPEIFKVESDSQAIMWFNLESPVMDGLQLTDYAERNIVDQLSVVDGVARIRLGGEKRYAMRIWIDRQELAARQLTVTDLERVLRAENVELPAGRVESLERDFTVRVERAYKTAEDFRNLVLGQGEDGHLIRLGEVARVDLEAEEERRDFRGNGNPQIGIGIEKQSNANTLEVSRGARAAVERIRETLPPSMTIYDSYDRSVFIQAAIDEVYKTLFISVGLVIFVIYLFLGNVKAALVPAVTVPIALIATFMVMDFAGFSINLLTLLALVLAIGLVVDDAIVVLENIYRRVEEGEPALVAAYRGAKQVAFAVIATTLVLIGVFVPIAFLEGSIGKLFGELALTLAAAVAFSSLIALSLSPMMCSKLLSRKAKKSWLTRKVDNWFETGSRAYEAGLRVCFNNKILITLGLFASLAIIAALMQKVPSELVPEEDQGGFFISVQGAEGASFQSLQANLLQVEAALMPLVESGDATRVITSAPRGAPNTGFGIVVLADWGDRERSAAELARFAQQEVSSITGVQTFVRPFRGLSAGGSNNPVEFVVGADSYPDLARFRDILAEASENNPGFSKPDTDYRETTPQLRVEINRNRAADLGVPVQEIGRTLETMLGGRRVTTFEDRGEEYNVVIRAGAEDRSDPNDISNIYVRSERSGELIPLSNLVTLRERASAGELRRFNRMRAVTLSSGLNEGYPLGEALEFLEDLTLAEMPGAAGIDYKGESRDFKEAGDAVYFTFALALLVVFLILAAQFESFIHPFIIMLTVPLAVAGALYGLYAVGSTLNIYSQIGIIMLIGLAAKNGILIVEFANQLRDQGLDVADAILESCRVRLRPILMTGLSTAMGAIPLVLATGPGSVSRMTIGVVIFSGVIFSTAFTLFVIPVFYKLLAPYTKSPGAIAARLKNYETEDNDPSSETLPAE